MEYKWERCPRCGSAKVSTGSGKWPAFLLFFMSTVICIIIANGVDNQLMEHPIAFGIIILIGLFTLFTCIKILKGGMTSRCETCNYAWEPTKIED